MILVWGSLDDPPTNRVLGILKRRGVDSAHLDDAELDKLHYDLTLDGDTKGWLCLNGRRAAVEEITGAYVRPGEPTGLKGAAAAGALLGLTSTIPANIVNRPNAGRSNWSKPFQLGLIALAGLEVPDTLVTTDPDAARQFLQDHGRIVYKSVSGIRSIVAAIDRQDMGRLDKVSTSPVQLQRWIDGLDVRVHVVGSRWFATSAKSDAIDYRYAAQQGDDVLLEPFDIPGALGLRLVALTRRFGLATSGIDLRLTPQGTWVCFEVNPSPGFTYYEDATGQPIGEAICDFVQGPPVAL